MSEKIKRIVNCPLCRQAVAWEGNPHRPFCSERCQLSDLGNWASGHYVIASEPCGPNNDEDDSERNVHETDD